MIAGCRGACGGIQELIAGKIEAATETEALFEAARLGCFVGFHGWNIALHAGIDEG